MFLSDGTIRRLMESDDPIIWMPIQREDVWGPILDEQIQPASVDVRLGTDFILHPMGSRMGLDEWFSYILPPGECILATTLESVSVRSNMIARIEGKSSIARKFVTIHSAGFLDPGFTGDITLEIKNDGRRSFELKPGMRIAQISWALLDANAERPYGHPGLNSHYQNQLGATEARA